MKMQKAFIFAMLLSVSAPGRAMALDWNDCRKAGEAIWNGEDFDRGAEVLGRLGWEIWDRPLAEQQRRWGLLLPARVDAKRPLVVLIHGLDGDEQCCQALGQLLGAEGFQTAIFCYPAEEPISRSGAMLAEHCAALRETFPNLKVEFVTQSMGGLVARDYVEGDDYAGGVDRLIMIAPPNGGSDWAGWSPVNKLIVNWQRWLSDPEWSAVWMLGEGFCQSGRDLKPGSEFLSQLNGRGRRAGVRYTIIAGDQPAGDRVAAEALDAAASALPMALGESWGVGEIRRSALNWAEALREKIGGSDGPVSLGKARLAGVGDVVVLHADHLSLYESVDGAVPAAWPVVRQRLESTDGP